MNKYVNHDVMLAAAERAVREEARRHPDDPWRMKEGDTHEFASAVADARKRLRNEFLAERMDQVRKAVNTRDFYDANGWPVPHPARNVLAWASDPQKISSLYFTDDEAENLDDALASLSRAIA